MKLLVTVHDQIKADLLLSFLKAHGINAHSSSDNAGGLEPQLTALSGVKIFVSETQSYKSEELLKEFESSDHSIDESFDPGLPD